jgi:hypothetical protein
MLWTYACSREEKFIGVYEAEANVYPGYPEVSVELKKGGEGIRIVQGKSLAFRWNTKGDKIRIYSQSGGIIVGWMEGKDKLVVEFPGPKLVYFKKIK